MQPDFALIEAIKHGDVSGFAKALIRGASLGARDINGDSALETAQRYGQLEFGRQLIKFGANVQAIVNQSGDTLLHRCCRCGDIGFAGLLLSKGADPNAVNVAGKTPLHWAVTKGFQYLSIELIESGADINKATPQGDQPLHIAARRGDVTMIKALLKAGANISATTNTGYTPLHEAAAAGHTQAAQLMIESGRIGYHERSILLPRVRRAAELHGQAATAEAIRAAEGGRERAEPPRELA